jgi:hypothetical protein
MQDDVLLAYQIAFDLVDNELQSFIIKVGTFTIAAKLRARMRSR